MQQNKKIVYVGDGLNDLAVCDVVARFVGYGGFFYRANVAAKSDFYLTSPSMAALLPLVLTEAEYCLLTDAEKRLSSYLEI